MASKTYVMLKKQTLREFFATIWQSAKIMRGRMGNGGSVCILNPDAAAAAAAAAAVAAGLGGSLLLLQDLNCISVQFHFYNILVKRQLPKPLAKKFRFVD